MSYRVAIDRPLRRTATGDPGTIPALGEGEGAAGLVPAF